MLIKRLIIFNREVFVWYGMHMELEMTKIEYQSNKKASLLE